MSYPNSNDVFDRNQLKSYITDRENDLAEFIGFRSCVARLAGFIAKMQALEEINQAEADQLLGDAYMLGRLTEKGQKYAKWCRNPPAELEILVLTNNKRVEQDA